jgi:hypothetical protein
MATMLKNVRLAFPALFTAKAFSDGAPKFSASLLMSKTDAEAVGAVKAAMLDAAKQKWGEKADAVLKSLVANGKTCLRDGDLKSEYDGFDGCLHVSATSSKRPLLLDADRTPLSEEDGRPYGGCYVNASIAIWAQDNQYGKRVNAELRGVQFFRDGDSFGGGGSPASADEFDNLADTGALADDFGGLM